MSNEIIDSTCLRRMLEAIGGDPADLDELLDDYRRTAPEIVAEISSAARSGDLDALRIAAHTLKSNARDFGAMRLSSLCADLERDCRAGAVPDPNAAVAAIAAEEAAARKALKSFSADDVFN